MTSLTSAECNDGVIHCNFSLLHLQMYSTVPILTNIKPTFNGNKTIANIYAVYAFRLILNL